MTTTTLGKCVGRAHVAGQKRSALVFTTDEPGWFIIITASGARFRRRREQIEWRRSS